MAYAALISVKQTIRGLLNGSDQILLPDSELKSINDELCYVQSVLESVSYMEGCERDDAWRKEIKCLATELEDLIIKIPISESSRDESLTRVKLQLVDRATTLKNEKCQQPSEAPNTEEERQPNYSFVPGRFGFGWNNEMVGLVHEQIKIQNWLLHHSKPLRVFSIVGRSGIGKTTLAKKIYEDQYVSAEFSRKFFVTIGKKYELKEFLLHLIDQMGIRIPDIQLKDDVGIGLFLHQHLVGRKYLLVLDDIRNTDAWNKLNMLFQDDGKSGSRIILTTTRQEVAEIARTSEEHFLKVPFLNEEQSWTLLKQLIFTGGERCPFQLEKLGQKIAKNCDGLPRAILGVANSLRDTRTVEYWSRVSEDTFLLSTTRDDSTFLEAYNQLPQHLKECFLYMGIFPPNYDIPTSKLLKLWVAEGLVRLQENKPVEKTAREYLDDLVSRNLVSVYKQSTRGKTKTCRIHFLDRKVCVSEGKRDKFFHVISKYEDTLEGLKSQSRLCIYNNVLLALKDVHSAMEDCTSEAHSLLCVGPQHQHWLPIYLSFMMLKVLDALTIRFHEFPLQMLQLVKLKYLAITYDGPLPASISSLHNLEVLIIHRFQRVRLSYSSVYLPVEIWMLRKLKHLDCPGFELPDPTDGIDLSLLLEGLLTLSGISLGSCRQRVFARIRKLAKLRIWVETKDDAAEAFSFFRNSTGICPDLDSFKCNVVIRGQGGSPIPAFPGAGNLKKITLSRCGFRWEDMNIIGGLPKLQVLKLQCYAFRGSDWESNLGEFLQLKFLLLECLDIEQWTLNDDCEDWEAYHDKHFPKLEHLIIRHCYSLVEIPDNIIDFPALKTIELDNCSQRATERGRELEKEQEESGNDEPQFRIHCAFCG